MIDRTQNGHYQLFVIHLRDNLLMLYHPWSTQTNEAMNKSANSHASKDRTLSTTSSLFTRVTVAGEVQGIGNHMMWQRIFHGNGLPFDLLLAQLFQNTDKKKQNKV